MATNIKTIIIFLLLSFGVYAQGQIWWIDTTAAGDEKRVYLGDFNKGYSSGGLNMGRLPVSVIVSPTSGATTTTYADTLNALSTDQTASLAITSNYIDIVNYSSAMAWVCVDGTYSTNAVPIPPMGGYRWAVATSTLHYKLSTGTGVIYIIAQ